MNTNLQQQVVRSFKNGAKHYHQLAQVQQRIADGFFDKFEAKSGKGLVLDIGCGTGFLTQRILDCFPQVKVAALDAADEMLMHLESQDLQLICADFDNIPLADESCDAVYSSLSLQWSLCLQQTLTEWLRVLKRGGKLCFATVLSGTLIEWDHCWRSIGDDRRSNQLPLQADFQAMALPDECEWVRVETETVTHYYPTVEEALASVREIGAGKRLHPSKMGLMGRQKWQSFLAAYEDMRTDKGLPLSYEVMYGTIEKK